MAQLSDDDYHHSLRVLPLWEKKVMMNMKMTEEEYLQVPIAERARNVCAIKLDDWFAILESEMRKVNKF